MSSQQVGNGSRGPLGGAVPTTNAPKKAVPTTTTLLLASYFILFCVIQALVFRYLHPSSSKVSSEMEHSLDQVASLPLNLWQQLWEEASSSSSSSSLVSPLSSSSSISSLSSSSSSSPWGWKASDTPMQVLQKLTTPSTPHECPPDTVAIENFLVESSFDLQNRQIPKVIHQTSKSPCLTPLMQRRGSVVQWQEEWVAQNGYSYVFHDDEAVDRLLLQREWPEFPLLHQVVTHCTIHPTVKADLWRYVVLWEFGGIYTDIDTAPALPAASETRFSPATLTDDTDAWMLVTYYGVLSQWHMVTSPRHPFMYYAVQSCLESLWMQPNAEFFKPVEVTGPNLLIRAFVAWMRDASPSKQRTEWEGRVNWSGNPMKAGVYRDANSGRSLTVAGTPSTVNDLVRRDVLGQAKSGEYEQLGMTYNAAFHQEDSPWRKTNQSCFHKLLAATTKTTMTTTTRNNLRPAAGSK